MNWQPPYLLYVLIICAMFRPELVATVHHTGTLLVRHYRLILEAVRDLAALADLALAVIAIIRLLS